MEIRYCERCGAEYMGDSDNHPVCPECYQTGDPADRQRWDAGAALPGEGRIAQSRYHERP